MLVTFQLRLSLWKFLILSMLCAYSGQFLNDQWRHCQLDMKIDLCFSETWCPGFVRQLSVLGIFDSDTSIITLIMGLLRTQNWNRRQKILKILPRKYFRFIKNWHYGIIRFEIFSIWKNISVERVLIIKT